MKSSLGGKAYAFSDMMDRVALLRDSYATFADLSPGMTGLGDRESLLYSTLKKEAVVEVPGATLSWNSASFE